MFIGGSLPRATAWCIAVACAAGGASAEPFGAWWSETWRVAVAAPEALDGVHVRWSAADLHVPAPGDLERMRAALARHPQHPDAGPLAVFERRMTAGPEWVELELWAGFGAMRVNTTLPGKGVDFHDMATTGATAWSLAPGTAMVNSRTTARAELDFAGSGRSVASRGLSLLTGGLANARHEFGIGEPAAVLVDGSAWRGTWSGQSPRGLEMDLRVTGGWNAAEGWGTVDQVTVTLKRDGRAAIVRYTSTGWRGVEGMSGGAAGQVARTTDGRPDWTLRLVHAGRVDRGTVATLVAEPSIARADPVRGDASIREIQDFRGNEPVVTRRTPTGSVETLGASDLPAGRRVRALDRLGWVVLASVIGGAALVWIWSRRRKRAEAVRG